MPTADGGFLLADTKNNRIRKVSSDGIITTVAGTGVHAFSGDGGPATNAHINDPRSLVALPGSCSPARREGVNHPLLTAQVANGKVVALWIPVFGQLW